MDKKLLYLAVALSWVLLLMPAQMRAQAGLQTDTDGSVTGTAGTEYLWVNAENFPDDEFRLYLQQMVATKTTGGQSYVVPADITHLNMTIPCCSYFSYFVGRVERRSYSRISIDDLPQDFQDVVNDFFYDEELLDSLYGEAEMLYGYPSSYYYIQRNIYKHSQTIISSIEEINGVHYIYVKDTVFYQAEVDVVYEGDFCSSEAKYCSGPLGDTRLLTSHNYYRPSGNVSDLTGIEHFANLQSLDCSNNRLTSLNLTSSLSELRRLNCAQNQLTSLDLTALAKLDSLDCSNNRLTDLKVNLVAHSWWSGSYVDEADRNFLAHKRVYLNCSNNFLTNLNNVTVTPTAAGQLVNIEGSYANNRILAFPIGKHPYYDLQQGLFFYNEGIPAFFFSPLKMNDAQKELFSGLGYSALDRWKKDRIALYMHTYDYRSSKTDYNGNWVHLYFQSPWHRPNVPTSFYGANSPQGFGINLSVIDKDRSRVGVAVPDNLRDEESRFEPVKMQGDDYYPEKVKQGTDTYYAYNSEAATADLDYCHHYSGVEYNLFNGYIGFIQSSEPDFHYYDESKDVNYDLSALNINKYADWFDPNINPYYDDFWNFNILIEHGPFWWLLVVA